MITGRLADYTYQYPGNPTGVSTSIFDADAGSIVIDSLTGAAYRKISPKGSNAVFTQLGITKAWSENFLLSDTADTVSVMTATGTAPASTTALLHVVHTPQANVLHQANIGVQTSKPTIVAAGLDIAGVQTNAIGAELFSNFLQATGRPFVVGSDPAFFFETQILIGDISGAVPLLIGFRQCEANNVTYTNYTNYASLGINASANPAALFQLTALAGTDVATDTTQTLADARAYTVRIEVSAAGVVTFKHDAAVAGTLAAPSAGAAYTFPDGVQVMPFIHLINGSDLCDSAVVAYWNTGFTS